MQKRTQRTWPTEPVDGSKYIVFKRNEFFELMGALALPPYFGQTTTGRKEKAGAHWDCAPIAEDIQKAVAAVELDDAVVVRRRDIFAAPALEAYANAMQCVIEALNQRGIEHEGNGAGYSTVDRLRDIADYFHEQSEKSYSDANRKLPD